MTSDGSISHCLSLLRQGDDDAMRVIWERYFPRLVRLARQHLAAVARHVADEEDVALSAMDRFCRAVREGRYPDLADRDGLWRLLLRITTRRALEVARREQRVRRGGSPKPDVVSRLPRAGWRVRRGVDCREHLGVERHEPSPAFAAEMAEACRSLLDRLPDADLRTLAVAKLEGYGNREAAERLGCSVRTVERRLRLIRILWRTKEPQ